ncbi:MAG: hypothetical protein ACI85I_001261 [Arenicella sp.]|jgi:hypothetical protein
MNNDLAPITLFVYNRPWHTEQTLLALQENDLASQSILYIFADGAKKDATAEQLEAVAEVKNLIKSKKWCGEVHIIEQTENKGLADSIIDGVTEVVNKYGKIIVLEDDLVTSKGFLKYMNDALSLYSGEESIAGISGYSFNYDSKGYPTTYLLPIGSSWGWATWAGQWEIFNPDASKLKREVEEQSLSKKMDFGYYPYSDMLDRQERGEVNSWAIRFYVSFFLKNMLFLFPNKSLVQNLGFDNSGENCEEGDNTIFDRRSNMTDYHELPKQKTILQKDVVKQLEKEFIVKFKKPSILTRIVRSIKRKLN